MTISVNSEIKDGYLLVTASGSIDSIEDFMAYVEPLLAKVYEAGIWLIFADERKLSSNLDYADIVTLTEHFAEIRVQRPLGIRVAILESKTTPQFNRNYETAANNRSMAYRAFEDEETAMAWLQERACLIRE